jgi:hypothetical protein
VDGTKIADDSINSEHYVDGSIDTAHIGNLQVTTAKIAADAIDGTKLADDAVDSEHYTDGSIDRVHLAADIVDGTKIADDSIDSEHYVDGSIDTAHIANDAVTLGTKTSGNYVATITAGTGISGSSSTEGGTPTIALATAGAGSGTYGSTTDGTKIDTITLDAYGRVTAVATGATGDIQGVTAGTNLTGGGTSGTVTLNMATGGAGAGSYGSTDDGTKIDTITLDAYGRVTAVATGATMDRWILEDGDGTEITITNDAEVKFVEGGGVDINWTDTSTGSDADPYDLTFTINTSVTAGNGLTGGGQLNASRTINVGAGTGIDVAADSISVDVSDFMSNGSNNRIITATGTDAMNAESNLTFDGSSLNINGNINAVDDITLAGSVYHEGDTDSYFGFHAANEWRVVTGGTEMLEVNNSYINLGANTRGSVQVTNVASSISPNLNTYNSFVLTLTGNINITNPSTEQPGMSGVFIIIQDGTGGRTVSLGTDYETAGGAGLTLSTAANAVDIVPYFVQSSGNILLGTPQLAFS